MNRYLGIPAFLGAVLTVAGCGQATTETGSMTLNKTCEESLTDVRNFYGFDSPFPVEAYCNPGAGVDSYSPPDIPKYEVTYSPNPFGPLNIPSPSSASTSSGSQAAAPRAPKDYCPSGELFACYVAKYPDLANAFNTRLNTGMSKSDWGKIHYCRNGRIEGRVFNGLSAASCGGNVAAATTAQPKTSAPPKATSSSSLRGGGK